MQQQIFMFNNVLELTIKCFGELFLNIHKSFKTCFDLKLNDSNRKIACLISSISFKFYSIKLNNLGYSICFYCFSVIRFSSMFNKKIE
jgi:hypothetical protein